MYNLKQRTMKQNYSIIKLFMLTVMAFFAGNAMAEDIIWSEDFSSYEANAVPSGGPYGYVCVDGGSATKIYNEALASGVKPELLIGKSGGSFSATIALGGKSGDVNLQFKTNRDNVTVEVTGATLGEKQRSGNTDTYTLTGASGTLTIKINAGSSNARLDDIKLYQGTALKPAGLSWGKASTNVTLGDEESYKNLPTLANENNLTVTCTSSDEAVATVSSAGVITIVGVGKATITAAFEGNSEYEAQTVSVEVTVEEGSSETPTSTTVANIAAMNALDNGTEFLFNGKVTVVYANDNGRNGYVYIKDDTGSSLIFKTGTGLEKGDVIKAGWEGEVSVYKNLFEVKPSTTLEKDGTAEVTYPEATAADVTKENMNKVVVLKGVTYGEINGKNFKINSDIAGYNQFGITIEAPVEGATYDIEGVISVYNENVQFQPISITRVPEVVDITVAPESGDIAEAVDAEAKKVTDEGNVVGNITINLTEKGSYTISKSLTSQGNVVINGAEGVTIDASALSAPFITLNGGTTFAPKADGTPSDHVLVKNVTIKDVTIKGQQGALLRDEQKSLVEIVTIENSVVEMPASGKNVLDFNGKGYAGKVIVKNSTIWSAGKNTGFFAQYGSRPKNVNGDLLQEFDVQNSTIVNIANGKNFCDLKQNGTAQNVYTIKNSIFADCGKSNQVVIGFNKGQTSATPVWDVDGNTFFVNGADGSEAETTKAGQKNGEDIVKNSLTTDPGFKDAANGDFTLASTSDQNVKKTGDPRWLVEVDPSGIININGNLDANAPAYNLAGQRVNAQTAKGIIIKNGRKYVK